MKKLYAFTALMVLPWLIGCASNSPIEMWQAQVEGYIQREGNGNPNAVRNLSTSPTRKEFGVIGREKGVLGKTRTDALGVLVGHRKIGGRYWFIFLVGVAQYRGGLIDVTFDYPSVQDIRAIAFCKHNGGYLWTVGHEDEARVAQYIRPQEADWRKSHPSRAGAKIPYPQFPTPKDRYRLSIDGRTVTVHEDHSGAHWQLDLSDSER